MTEQINCPFCGNLIASDALKCEKCDALFKEPELPNLKFKELAPFLAIDVLTLGFFSTIWFFINAKAINDLTSKPKDGIKLNWLVMLLALKDDYIFSLTAPAKLQAYMAAAKPVVAMIDGEARNLIADSNCGVSSPAKDYQGLAENILKLSKMNGDDLRAYGENGWNYYRKYFTKEKCIDNLCAMLADGNSN